MLWIKCSGNGDNIFFLLISQDNVIKGLRDFMSRSFRW